MGAHTQRTSALLEKQDVQANQDITFITDGGEEVRSLAELIAPASELQRRVRERVDHPGNVMGESGARMALRSLSLLQRPAHAEGLALVSHAHTERDSATVFAVGPTPMMRACADLAAEAGAGCLVSLENPMACGFGVCLGCAAPRAEGGFSLVCKAGPVFEATEIAWEGLP